jgi:hypothetical protein
MVAKCYSETSVSAYKTKKTTTEETLGISGSHSGEYMEYYFIGCDTV